MSEEFKEELLIWMLVHSQKATLTELEKIYSLDDAERLFATMSMYRKIEKNQMPKEL